MSTHQQMPPEQRQRLINQTAEWLGGWVARVAEELGIEGDTEDEN